MDDVTDEMARAAQDVIWRKYEQHVPLNVVNAALIAGLAARPRVEGDAVANRLDATQTVCAEAYQAFGAMADILGYWQMASDDPDQHAITKLLDNLNAASDYGPIPHADLLPFVLMRRSPEASPGAQATGDDPFCKEGDERACSRTGKCQYPETHPLGKPCTHPRRLQATGDAHEAPVAEPAPVFTKEMRALLQFMAIAFPTTHWSQTEKAAFRRVRDAAFPNPAS